MKQSKSTKIINRDNQLINSKIEGLLSEGYLARYYDILIICNE